MQFGIKEIAGARQQYLDGKRLFGRAEEFLRLDENSERPKPGPCELKGHDPNPNPNPNRDPNLNPPIRLIIAIALP